MDAATSNRVTLGRIPNLPLGEISRLPVEQPALLQGDLAEEKARIKRIDDWLNGALNLRYGDRAQALRRAQGKDAGAVRVEEEDGFVAVCDLPKKVEYDQDKLRVAVETVCL
jgi:hypothetical protein